jgi:hypothetical protein
MALTKVVTCGTGGCASNQNLDSLSKLKLKFSQSDRGANRFLVRG